jgi:hypothetical protein
VLLKLVSLSPCSIEHTKFEGTVILSLISGLEVISHNKLGIMRLWAFSSLVITITSFPLMGDGTKAYLQQLCPLSFSFRFGTRMKDEQLIVLEEKERNGWMEIREMLVLVYGVHQTRRRLEVSSAW